MKRSDLADDAAAFLHAWTASVGNRDIEAARALRTSDCRLTMPDGRSVSDPAELDHIATNADTIDRVSTHLIEVRDAEDGLSILFDCFLRSDWGGGVTDHTYRGSMELVRCEGKLLMSALSLSEIPTKAESKSPTLLSRLRNLIGRRQDAPETGRQIFQDLAYAAYRPGEDYRLPRSVPNAPCHDESALPVPPKALWLGYNYPVHGKLHVDTMMETVTESGLTFRPGDRILDLGCSAGRMIRHLAPLSRSCEIWGADISAEHILWCQRNLSPPFHFVTNIKVPHLPFGDAHFRFIYCGSVFTHIDDMARGWLLELRRLLSDDGFAYLTIHDERTVQLFDAYVRPPAVAEHIMGAPMWAEAKNDSDMFTIGRDEESQVFYARDWFERLLAPMFEVIAIRPEAYFYQTAILIRPKA